MKYCCVLLSRWELSFCPPSLQVWHTGFQNCMCQAVQWCLSATTRLAPRSVQGVAAATNTRHSPVSNLLGVSFGQVLWSSNIWVTKGRQYAWLVRFWTKGILERELPALACSLPEDRKLFSILLTPSLLRRTPRWPRHPEELERGAIALSSGACLNPSSAMLTSEKLSWDKILILLHL